MKYYIYSITNLVNGKRYIGQTVDAVRRKTRHMSELRNGVHCNCKLQRAFDKYSEEDFMFEVLLETDCEKEEIGKLEMEYVAKYDSYHNGYNQNEGGFINNGFESKFTKEDVFNILSVSRHMKKSGARLADFYKTSVTTIYRIRNGLSHYEYHSEFELLNDDEVKTIYDNFCKDTGLIEKRLKSMSVRSCRALSKEQVFYCLSVFEFDYRKAQPMAKKLGVDTATLTSLRDGRFYKDFKNEYENLDYEIRRDLYEEARQFFNFVSSHRNVC